MGSIQLSHTHFRQMRKHLANVEKEWNIGALGGVKNELIELKKMTREIEDVIKNQLYYNLDKPEMENKKNGKGISGRGTSEVA